MAVLPVGIGSEEAAGGYQIERSLRFNSADSPYLNRTFGTPTNGIKWTWSSWIKRGSLGSEKQIFTAGVIGSDDQLVFDSSDRLVFYIDNGNSYRVVTTPVYRDVSAWYHIMLVYDSANATSSNRVKLYVNGSQVTALTTASYPAQNTTTKINASGQIGRIGLRVNGSSSLDGYMAEVHFVDGQALTPTDFGEFNEDTGVWQPIEYTGTYGTNGFYLNFADNSGTTSTTLGADSSGNSNNWTPTLFSVAAGVGNDSLVDSPTRYGTDTGAGGEVRGNYCTWNTLQNAGALSISNGNLDIASKAFWANAIGTLGATSGKWYFEAVLGNRYGSYQLIGIVTSDVAQAATNSNPYTLGNIIFWSQMQDVYVETTSYSTTNYYDSTVRTASVAFDLDNWKFHVRMDGGAWQNSGDPAAGTGGYDIPAGMRGKFFLPIAGPNNVSVNPYIYANFGQRPFAYTAPSGFKALCTTNLLEADSPTIADGSQHFDVALWTGNGSTQSVTTLSFQPDLVWAKSRSLATQHALVDVVRNYYQLSSSLTDAEKTTVTGFDSIRSDGFNLNYTVGGDRDWWNANTYTYVAWNWKAGGSGVNNTAGSISSTVSANTTSGFSIVRWTGTGGSGTLGHGLGVAPEFVVYKRTSAGGDSWVVYHKGITNSQNGGIYLNLPNAWNSDSSLWNNTAPTSSVFSVGNYGNGSGETRVAYCFAPVAGYSAMSSYVGNNSSDGPFVFTGFRPAYILIKSTASGSDWCIYDAKRLGYNVDNNLQRNVAAVEQADDDIDFLSNGFKFRRASPNFNGSGTTHIYMAFAENPFAYSLAR